MGLSSLGRGTPRSAATLMATGVAVLVIGALLDGAVSLVFVVAGVVLLGAGAVLLGRLPKRRKD